MREITYRVQARAVYADGSAGGWEPCGRDWNDCGAARGHRDRLEGRGKDSGPPGSRMGFRVVRITIETVEEAGSP